MVFGHNTNLTLGALKFHVQTEDRGESHALIDTTVYYNGRVLHRRTNSYLDLLPMNEDREEALKLRVDDQHHTVIEELRSGKLQLPLPQEPERAAPPRPAGSLPKPEKPDASEPAILRLELVNAKSWISGKNAVLQVLLRDEDGEPVKGARVDAQIKGSDDPRVYSAVTGARGEAKIEFPMPRIIESEAELLIRAENQMAQGHVRFALRAKSRVPSV
jgi:hypothetical protein